MWRKNRQTNEGSECVGRDVNRNWPHKWDGEGSSPDPCDETFRGIYTITSSVSPVLIYTDTPNQASPAVTALKSRPSVPS